MNSAHRKTLAAVFATPTPNTLEWARVEALLLACGCRVTEGTGSRVRVSKGNDVLNAHRPHPGKEAKRYQLLDVKNFLTKIGVTPPQEDA